MGRKTSAAAVILVTLVIAAAIIVLGYISTVPHSTQESNSVPHEAKYGIYCLDLATSKVDLVYCTDNEIYTSALRLNSAGDTFVFAQKINGDDDSNGEIFTIGTNGKNLTRITTNSFFDLYPAWSPDGKQIAFLSKRDKDLDIYLMNANGENEHKLYDSGTNDADIDWSGNTIVFTSNFTVWAMRPDGTSPRQITSPANAGQWGTANLPIGDYDPRLSPNSQTIVFERLENPDSTHGEYNIFTIDIDGQHETQLTYTGYSQGLACFSHRGDKIAYIVAAIGDQGKYDIYLMNTNGDSNNNVTPSYFPTNFLCYSPFFSVDDSKIYFIGQWTG